MGYNTPKRLFNFASTPPTEGLVAAWNGSTLNDSFGVNHLTNNNGVTFVAGKVNNCFNLDGVNQFLSLADNANISYGAGKKFSCSGWFFLDTFATTMTILSKWSGGTNNREYEIFAVTTDKSLRFIVSPDGIDQSNFVSTGANTVFPGVWYFFTTWYDGSKLYIELNSSGTILTANYTGDIFNGAASLNIGAEAGTGGFLDGRIDSIRLGKHDNRVFTAYERRVLYNNGIGREFVSQNVVLADEVNLELNQLINIFNGIITDTTPKMSVDLAEPALTINQNGVGSIAQFLNNNVLKAEINNQGQLKSYIATGTAPIVMSAAATTRIDNLNVDLLDDIDSSAILQATSFLTLHNSVMFWTTDGITVRYITLDGDTIIGIKINVEFPGSTDWVSLFNLYDSGNHLLDSIALNGATVVNSIVVANITVVANLYKIEFVPLSGTTSPDNITVSIITKKLAVAN